MIFIPYLFDSTDKLIVIFLLAGLHEEPDRSEYTQAVPLDVVICLEVTEVLVLDVYRVTLKQPGIKMNLWAASGIDFI